MRSNNWLQKILSFWKKSKESFKCFSNNFIFPNWKQWEPKSWIVVWKYLMHSRHANLLHPSLLFLHLLPKSYSHHSVHHQLLILSFHSFIGVLLFPLFEWVMFCKIIHTHNFWWIQRNIFLIIYFIMQLARYLNLLLNF